MTTRGIFLIVSLLTGLILLSNFVDYQHTLSTGDHGLVLYAAEATLRGERPFHDYHYFYGPLMPYYFGAFLKLFGTRIVSLLVGQQFLTLLSGVLIYSAVSLFLRPFVAFAATLWFWVFNKPFFYTYNHDGIVTASFFVLFCALYYLKFNKPKSLYFGLLGCFVAGLIKLNFGFSLLLGLILSVLVINIAEKRSIGKSFYLYAFLLTPILILSSNFLFVVGLPFYIIKQCYQYFGNDAVLKYYPDLTTALRYLLDITYKGLIKSWYTEFTCIIIAIICIANIYQIKKGKITAINVKEMLLLVSIPLIFYGINLHEFLLSGIYFRTFHAFPFIIVIIFLLLGYFAKQTPQLLQYTITAFVCLIAAFQFYTLTLEMRAYRIPMFYIPLEKAKIFVSNRIPWPQTVTNTAIFLQENVKDDEMFLALPYDPLYYYLADKKSPTRQLALFDFLQIPQQQEEDIIADIERNNVNWIVISNRAITEEIGLGIFGTTYAKLLAKYIDKHFEIVAEAGEWTPKPSWAWFHGTRILKRKGIQ